MVWNHYFSRDYSFLYNVCSVCFHHGLQGAVSGGKQVGSRSHRACAFGFRVVPDSWPKIRQIIMPSFDDEDACFSFSN